MLKTTSIYFLILTFSLTLINCTGCPAEKPATRPETIPQQAQTPQKPTGFADFKKLFLPANLPQDINPGDETMGYVTLPTTSIESIPSSYEGDVEQYKLNNPFLINTGCCEYFPGFYYGETPSFIALIYRQTNGFGEGGEFFILTTYAPSGKVIDHKTIAFKEADLENSSFQGATLEGNYQISARKTEVVYDVNSDDGERKELSRKENFITYQINPDGQITSTIKELE